MELHAIRQMLRINRHRLDEELEIHSQMMDTIGQEVVRLNSKAIELKKKLEETEAKVVERIKDQDPKMTNPQAERECKRDREYSAAWSAHQQARHEHDEWELIAKAWYQRGFDLKALGELFAAQYFSLDSVRGPYPSNMESLRADMRRANESKAPTDDAPRVRRRSIVSD